MRTLFRSIGIMAAVSLASACAVYNFKAFDGPGLAKPVKGKIIKVRTVDETYDFLPGDPPAVKNGAVIGNLHLAETIDPLDIVELTPEKKAARIVLMDGRRFLVKASFADGEVLRCDAVKAVCIPLDEIVRADIRKTNVGATIFGTLAGVALVAGAIALDVALNTDDEGEFDLADSFTGDFIASAIEDAPALIAEESRRHSNKAILGLEAAADVAAEKEFWTKEWEPVEALPGADGRVRLRLENTSNVTRGVDEAKLVVIDHPAGIAVAPDVLGAVRTVAVPVAPSRAVDGSGADIRELVAAKDGALWRSAGGEPAPGARGVARDEISLVFSRPKGSCRARLIVGVSNTTWRSEFAREVLTRTGPPVLPAPPGPPAPARKPKTAPPPKPPVPLSDYRPWEFTTLRVKLLTAFGWQTGQVLFAVGPRPAEDMIYDLELDDVPGDTVQIRLSPPSGYWLIDHVALDFGPETTIETAEISPESTDVPDAAEVLRALATEDATTFILNPADPPAELTFNLPPAKEGMVRSLFLRTVSCYETPPAIIHNR
jgi:hypothetical protein